MKKKILFTALTAIAMFTACSDNASTENPTDPTSQTQSGNDSTQVETQLPGQSNPLEDSVSTNPPDIKDTVVNPNTGDTSVTVVDTLVKDTNSQVTPPDTTANKTDSTSTECNPTPVEFPLDKFVDVGEIYNAIQCNEKVVFMVRHAEREADNSVETPITEEGIEESQAMGAKLKGPVDFVFYHTEFLRTYQTAENIAIGRDQTNFKADTIRELTDTWYRNPEVSFSSIREADTSIHFTNDNEFFSLWAYEGKYAEAFYDLETRSEELLHKFVIKDYEQMPKYTVIVSHDRLLMPLTVYATQKKINLRLHDETSRKWLYYLGGIAVIINDKNEVRYVAAKGGPTGTNKRDD